MLNFKRYKRVPVVNYSQRQWPNKEIQKAPIWCSVDLRDGNQALIEPMTVEEKVEMFQLLVKLGFKEIEIGFPAASQIEFDFLRKLVAENMIPDYMKVQVLCQCRQELIARTFEAIQGIPNVIFHIYNSTSTLQRDVVFRKEMPEIIDIAIAGTRMVKEGMKNYDGNLTLEYSPESFTGTELDFALEICTAVQKEWNHANDNPIIFNLPATVEMNTPNVYADQIEWMSTHFEDRDNVILSVHPHNDRGCAVADSEMGLLAGGDRIEGTLFGNGERTGNVDIITLALNMYSQGIDPGLDFSNLPEITEVYEKVTRMHVYERQPYSGQLVFAAFSGSHQDAIAKGMKFREEKHASVWNVPYLPIDPTDVGRIYEADVIRINSQSGKGGIGYIMETQFKYVLPPKMREAFGYHVKSISDHAHKELQPSEVYEIFKRDFVNLTELIDVEKSVYEENENGFTANATIKYNGSYTKVTSSGNGRLDAISNALKEVTGIDYSLDSYTEHDLEGKSSSKAASYVSIKLDGKTYWGTGVDSDIIISSVKALISAVNIMLKSINK